MANQFAVGDKVKAISGDFRGAQGEIIDREAFEALHGSFDLPDWALFVQGDKSGAIFWVTPEEIEAK